MSTRGRGGFPQSSAYGRGEKMLDTPQSVIAYLHGLPAERYAMGIFITMDFTHLSHPDIQRAARHYDYSKIYLSVFFFAECACHALAAER